MPRHFYSQGGIERINRHLLIKIMKIRTLKQPKFKCQSCEEIVDMWNEQRDLCEDCYEEFGIEYDKQELHSILNRRGFEWCIRNLTK